MTTVPVDAGAKTGIAVDIRVGLGVALSDVKVSVVAGVAVDVWAMATTAAVWVCAMRVAGRLGVAVAGVPSVAVDVGVGAGAKV